MAQNLLYLCFKYNTMPKLYEYLGLILRFFSNDHEPIHVHAFYKESQLKVEFTIENGIITNITYSQVAGYSIIPKAKMKDLEALIEVSKYDLIQLWVKFYVLNEKVSCKKITTKLK